MADFTLDARWGDGRRCPVCGSTSYIETYVDVDETDDRPKPKSYCCSGCSVVFTGPFAFGEAGRKKSEETSV